MALLSGWVRPRFPGRWAMVLGCAIAAGAREARAQEPGGSLEQQVKAAYLLNFTRYVDWPPEAFPDGEAPVNLCVLGDDAFGTVADETVSGHRSRGRPVRVLQPDTPAQTADCHVAYLAPRRRVPSQLLERLRGRPILLVGDGPDFLARGGMIAFVIVDETVRFEIDPAAATRAGLRISSRVLALATRVREAANP